MFESKVLRAFRNSQLFGSDLLMHWKIEWHFQKYPTVTVAKIIKRQQKILNRWKLTSANLNGFEEIRFYCITEFSVIHFLWNVNSASYISIWNLRIFVLMSSCCGCMNVHVVRNSRSDSWNNPGHVPWLFYL